MTARERRGSAFAAVAMIATLALAECAAPPPPPAMLALTIAGGADQNPDPAGQPAPVAVRLFQLTAMTKFEHADVFALSERDRATLGQDEAGVEDYNLRPGESRNVKLELRKGVQAVGVVVLFRDIDHATWRATQPVTSSGPNALTLKIVGVTAMLAPS